MKNKQPKKIRQVVYRSAITGYFVKASYAKRYPKRVVRENIKA